LSYQGRLLDENDYAVVGTNVLFKMQIRTPGPENCLLFEETQYKDLSQTEGIFSLSVNDGTGQRIDSGTYTIEQVFSNRGTFNFPATYCASGTTYTPNPNDGRRIQLFFNDGTLAAGEFDAIAPIPMNFVPMSLTTLQIGGYGPSQILKIADGVPATQTELNNTQWTEFLALINGTSVKYLKPTDAITNLNGAALPSIASGESIRWNGSLNSNAGGWEAFTPGQTAGSCITALTGEVTAAGPGSAAATIAANAVTSTKINDGAVTTTKALTTNPGISRIVGTDGTTGSTLTKMECSTVGEVLSWTVATGWQCNAISSIYTAPVSSVAGKTGAVTLATADITDATSANTASMLVKRDVSGNFSAGTITGTGVVAGALQVTGGTPASGKILTSDATGNASWQAMTSSQWTTTGSDIYYNTGNVGIGTIAPSNNLSVTPLQYSTGTASQSLTTVTGSGTTWTSAMVGSQFVFANGVSAGKITAFGSATSLTVTASQTVSSQGYKIGYTGLQVSSTGNVGIGTTAPGYKLDIDSGFFHTSNNTTIGPSSDIRGGVAIGWNRSNGTAETDFYNVYPNASYSFQFLQNTGSNNYSSLLSIFGNGSVGIGTTAPRQALDVSAGTLVTKAATVNATSTIDWALGNLQYTAASCGNFQFNNMTDGGSYMFAVQGTTAATCNFTAFSDVGVTGLVVHMPPDNAATIATKQTVFNMVVMGTHVYVSWTPGY
jgi:hypothetical protein